jgi:UDP:flavonoid glycosyltransferase YjiC (YdhE family)
LPLPENVRVEFYVPHAEVLKRACLLVSHAGHGVVLKALYYGVPMVLVPWGRDQPGVAARAEALGVATVIPREGLSEARLAEAATAVLGTHQYRVEVQRHSKRLQSQNPVGLACQAIETLLNLV